MAYVRTISYTFPYERIEEFRPGSDLMLRLVSAHKLLCQESPGLLDTGVWMTQEPAGSIRVVSYTEWYSLEDIQAFATDPDVEHQEATITKVAASAPTVEIYQTIG